MNRLPKHSELDSELMPIDNPMGVFWAMGCLSSGLVVVSVWLGLLAAIAAGWLSITWPPFVWGPVVGWLALLGLPALYASRRAALGVLNAIAATAEAWLARAGYSIDLNGDGYTGWQSAAPVIEPPAEIRPLIVSAAPQGVRLLAQDAPAAGPLPETIDEAGPVNKPAPPPRPKVWTMPNGAKVPEATVCAFVDGIFTKGTSRAAWVGKGKPLDRETHEALLGLLERVGLLVDRKQGNAGRLTVHTAAAARALLKLPPAPVG